MHMVQVFRVVLFLVSLLVHFDQVCYSPVKIVKLKRGRTFHALVQNQRFSLLKFNRESADFAQKKC